MGATLQLESPVSLGRVVKFGVIFLALSCAGTVAQRHPGNVGFFAVSLVRGTISGASATATAAALAAACSPKPPP